MNIRYCNSMQYQLKKKISSGSFGVVFLAVDTVTREEVAIKVEKSDSEEMRSLDREVIMFSKLTGLTGVPKFYWSGTEMDQNLLVLQLLGKDLAYHMKQLRKFSLKTILMLADGLIPVLQGVHSRGIVHRDLKPENIMLGRDNDQSQVYLVDYGISKAYKDNSGRHIPYRDCKPFIGTTRYASIAAHKGQELSRKDDIESMVYVLIFLYKGVLPWQNINAQDSNRTRLVGEMKMSIDLADLCKEMPHEILLLLEYSRKLTFKQEPDYQYMLMLLKRAADNNHIVYDYVYDWTDPKTIRKYKTNESTNSNEIQKQPSGIERKMTNQIWWSVVDQPPGESRNRLLPPDPNGPGPGQRASSPSNSDRQESRKQSYSSQRLSSKQGSFSSMKIKYVPTVIQEEDDSRRGLKQFKSIQPEKEQKDNFFLKSKTLGNEMHQQEKVEKKEETYDYNNELIDENMADIPLNKKYENLRRRQVLTY